MQMRGEESKTDPDRQQKLFRFEEKEEQIIFSEELPVSEGKFILKKR